MNEKREREKKKTTNLSWAPPTTRAAIHHGGGFDNLLCVLVNAAGSLSFSSSALFGRIRSCGPVIFLATDNDDDDDEKKKHCGTQMSLSAMIAIPFSNLFGFLFASLNSSSRDGGPDELSNHHWRYLHRPQCLVSVQASPDLRPNN